MRANSNFLILEASDRHCGRIITVEMKSSSKDGKKVFVDSGAQWLHGRNNELFKLADKHNLVRSELSEEAEGDFVREDGKIIDPYFVKKVDFKIGQILEECEAFAITRLATALINISN
jgi:spermine oxidase